MEGGVFSMEFWLCQNSIEKTAPSKDYFSAAEGGV
jgi:hypothetical protein